MNWMGPAFASTGAEMATKGIKNPLLAKSFKIRNESPNIENGFKKILGLPGLAVSAGMWGYDKWKE